MKQTIVLLTLLLAPLAAAQRDSAHYIRFLLPVLTSAEGANGAKWQTALTMRNDGPQSLDAFPLQADCTFGLDCLRIRGYPAFQPYQDGFGMRGGYPAPFTLEIFGFPGAFLYVERSAASQFSAQLEIADFSHRATQPTTLPVPRENDFFTGRHSISGVPFTPAARISVRIYQLEPKTGAEVAVRAYDFGSSFDGPNQFSAGKFLAGTGLAFQHPDPPFDGCPFQLVACPDVPYHPGYAQIANLLMAMPQIASKPSVTQMLRVEFEPADPNELYWPMITVTDNVTNAVQVFTIH